MNHNPLIEWNSAIGLRPKRAVICSVSHAWEAREHPDPCGHQLPGRMPHALEYVIIQKIFILIPKFYADQIDGSRSTYFRVTQDKKLSQSSLYSWNSLCFGIWVSSSWTLKAWYITSSGSTLFFGPARCCNLYCNRLSWSVCSFPPLDPLKNWLSAMLFTTIILDGNFKQCHQNGGWQSSTIKTM